MKNGREIDAPRTAAEVVQSKPVVIDTGCKWTAYILISKADVLTPGTARMILNHNETRERNCENADRERKGN